MSLKILMAWNNSNASWLTLFGATYFREVELIDCVIVNIRVAIFQKATTRPR